MVSRHFRPLTGLIGLVVVFTAGCAACCHTIRPHAACSGCQGIVYAVDGAGAFEAPSSALRQAVGAAGLPLCVETFDWSHGFGRVLADQIDYEHAVVEGRKLACRIVARRQAYPDLPIYVVSHSAGSAVVLAAAEDLPPGSVDRLLLLAPSVSACYDLRPALCSTRAGIDVFFSCRDRLFLGVGTTLFGTTDRCWGGDVAGRTGFHPVPQAPGDAILFRKLRQHPWHPSLEWTGNFGGHYGPYQPGYLRAYVLPILMGM